MLLDEGAPRSHKPIRAMVGEALGSCHLLFGFGNSPELLQLAFKLGLAICNSACQLSLLSMLGGQPSRELLLTPL